MVLDDMPGLAEPEFAERCQDAALLGNRIGQDHIEGADAVSGDKQQRVAKIKNLAHLAAFEFLDASDVDLCDCVRHNGHLKYHYMNPSRKFKENVLVVGFFSLSVAVVVILVVGAWKGRTSVRASTPTTEQVNH